MKRRNCIYVLGCLLIFGLLSLGSGSTNDSSTQKASTVKGDESGAASEESTKESSDFNQATIDEQVLYDDNDIKITATSLEDSLFGSDLKVLIENNSSQNITVQARNANVNGYMVSTMMSDAVASGKKANGELTFETSGLKDCGIEQIGTIEFIFHIFDSAFFLPIAPRIIPIIAIIAPSHPKEPAEKRPINKAIIPNTNEATPILDLLLKKCL